MKKISIALFALVLTFSSVSCEPTPISDESHPQTEIVADCCGELGQFPSEPEEEEEED